MDLYFLISAVLGMFSVVLSAGLAAPTEHPRDLSPTHSSGGGRVRTKRCSCATFLDKECVYFCHLDIIWVNTPERVVSYGLGNAPRRRRSVPGSRSTESTRCVCLQRDDRTCDHFCQPRTQEHREKSENMSSVHSPECSSSRCQQPPPLTSAQSKVKCLASSRHTVILSPKLRAVVQTRTILEKWRMRRKERSRPQQLNLLKT
ncbi:endothelin-1 [Boleophthalmus pectinirostris]|uniref:endothelin-1 n=1 Tax=Boleophthalmus pectinirostris TaxID=150288 RepID=UPI00242B70AB|nr:endothelin-1 [Boleophthalmus pectinirostris]